MLGASLAEAIANIDATPPGVSDSLLLSLKGGSPQITIAPPDAHRPGLLHL